MKSQELICRLASILRIADGLDYRHMNIIKDIQTTINKEDVIFTIISSISAREECAQAMKKSDLFETVFKKKVKFVNKIVT
jgi:hypothetical protein